MPNRVWPNVHYKQHQWFVGQLILFIYFYNFFLVSQLPYIQEWLSSSSDNISTSLNYLLYVLCTYCMDIWTLSSVHSWAKNTYNIYLFLNKSFIGLTFLKSAWQRSAPSSPLLLQPEVTCIAPREPFWESGSVGNYQLALHPWAKRLPTVWVDEPP